MIETLKKRPEFLRLRGGYRAATPTCVIEAKRRIQNESAASASSARFGFTVTKKLGNAVERNRIRRRLRAAVQELAPLHAIQGFDYVIVARREALTASWDELLRQLRGGLRRIDRARHPKA